MKDEAELLFDEAELLLEDEAELLFDEAELLLEDEELLLEGEAPPLKDKELLLKGEELELFSSSSNSIGPDSMSSFSIYSRCAKNPTVKLPPWRR